MRKRLFTIWMVLALVISMGFSTAVFADEDGGEIIDKSVYIPELTLINGPVFDIKAGQKNEITMQIKNASSYVAYSVVINPVLTDLSSNPFNLYWEDDDNYRLSSISGRGGIDMKLIVEADTTAEAKTYACTLNYLYFNTYGKKYTGTSTFYLKVQTGEVPEYSIENFKMDKEILMPGSVANISADIVNNGKINMYDVLVSLTGLEPTGVSINNGSDSQRLEKVIVKHPQSFSFNIIANANMKEGNYPITIKIACKDVDGKAHEYEKSFFITVGKGESKEKPVLEIQNMSEPPGVYVVNQNFPVTFDLVNTGAEKATNIKVSASGGEGGVVVPKSTSMQVIEVLGAQETRSFEFLFAGTSAASSQNYPIQFTVTYEDGTKSEEGAANTVTISQYAGANVRNVKKDKEEEKENEKEEDKDKKESKPKIIISEYRADPMIVMAGSEFDLTMTFLNTHALKAVKNIKMFLTMSEEKSGDTEKTGNIFTPVESSNTFYFDSIGCKQTVSKSLRLFVVPDAQPKTYTLTVNFEYEDIQGNEYTSTELLGINVKQATKVEFGEIYIPQTSPVGMPIPVAFDIYNTGKVTLNNLMIKIEGDVETENKSTFIGNFESGISQNFDASFIPVNMGETPVSIIITYEDASGESMEERFDYIIDITEPMMEEGMMGDMGEMDQKPPVNYLYVGLGAGAGLLTLILIVVFMKKRKAKKEARILEEEDEFEYDSHEADAGNVVHNPQEEEALVQQQQEGQDANEQL